MSRFSMRHNFSVGHSGYDTALKKEAEKIDDRNAFEKNPEEFTTIFKAIPARRTRIRNRLSDVTINDLSLVDIPAVQPFGKGRGNFVLYKRQTDPRASDYEPVVRWTAREKEDVFGDTPGYLWKKLREDEDLEDIVAKVDHGGTLTRSEASVLKGCINLLILKAQVKLLKRAVDKLSPVEYAAAEADWPIEVVLDGDDPTIAFCDPEDGSILQKGLQFGPNPGETSHYMSNDGTWKPVRRHPDGSGRFHSPKVKADGKSTASAAVASTKGKPFLHPDGRWLQPGEPRIDPNDMPKTQGHYHAPGDLQMPTGNVISVNIMTSPGPTAHGTVMSKSGTPLTSGGSGMDIDHTLNRMYKDIPPEGKEGLIWDAEVGEWKPKDSGKTKPPRGRGKVCPTCDGTGKSSQKPSDGDCPTCGGTGRVHHRYPTKKADGSSRGHGNPVPGYHEGPDHGDSHPSGDGRIWDDERKKWVRRSRKGFRVASDQSDD